ncbi:MAG: flavin reductase family protein [Campylobacterales bacterium]
MIIDFTNLDKLYRYKIMSEAIAPRPIAWISTLNDDSSINLAPFSYFIPISSEPPLVSVSIGIKKSGESKDTLKNIRENKKCAISIPDISHAKEVSQSSDALGYGISETSTYNIETVSKKEGFPPIYKKAKAALFCTLFDDIRIEGSVNSLLLLKIESVYTDDNYIDNEGKVVFEQLGRTGRDYIYAYKKISQEKTLQK